MCTPSQRPDHPPSPLTGAAAVGYGIENARTLAAAFERGLDRRADIMGWHGTSLEAMESALRHGVLLPSPVAHGMASAGSSVFYFPVDEQRDFTAYVPGKFVNNGRPRAVRTAISHLASYDPEGGEALATLASWGTSRERLVQVTKEAQGRKGVLIALSLSATADFPNLDGDRPGWDRRLVVPGGLPLSAIAGVDPLGDQEFTFFEQLQTQVESQQS